ncbi:heavy metal translocating P-type ATPase [Collinsella sp. AF23-2]|nr:heavy metal translocating P-type ATPase [Collinsella sp. AF23-6]RGS25989.1 heavy metal translocating P-type ATPase [Collinsella sp. AF23-3LB]RGS27923.1 heavy metal translocating P-type ATPase [Collinsella sp. AF23-2]
MRFSIINEIPGRTRLQLAGPVPEGDLDALLKLSGDIDGVHKVRVYGRIGQMALEYDEQRRAGVLDALGALDSQAIADAKTGYVMQLEPRRRKLVMDLATLVGAHYARRWFLPTPLRAVFVVAGYMTFLRAAFRELAQPRLTVPVLDASAIGISFAKRDVDTAGQTMFLLNVGELLEDYTRAMSENELINSLLDVPDKAQKVVGDTEVSVAATELEPGDLVAVRTGMSICIDGVVEQGSAMVNQATLTGEPLAVERSVGDDVFAGTVVEDGSILVRVRANTAQTKLRSIVSLVQTADSLKSEGQSHMEDLANKIVPWNFLLAGLVALTTRSLIKTSAALMVDYSCALKLTGSVAVMTAMSDAAKMGVMVKGAKYFESFAKADTIVFDKTGTLTEAQPRLACVLTTDGWSEDEVLRLSACLEEHFPHPVARAVVNAARERGLEHRERHAAVEYIVAHGIASSIEGRRAIIGSAHFVFEDESAQLDSDIKERIESQMQGLSPLYLAVDGTVVGVLGIEDPLKPGVREAIADLHALGVKHVVMLTGDSERTAERIAREAGVDEFKAELLPEDKYAYVERIKSEGRHVAMVGDGVNDSPALGLADVGLAMGGGSDIAKEVADIILADTDLAAIVRLRRMSQGLIDRLTSSYSKVMLTNSALLALGITGAITPQASSLLHNGSTIAYSLSNAKAYLR